MLWVGSRACHLVFPTSCTAISTMCLICMPSAFLAWGRPQTRHVQAYTPKPALSTSPSVATTHLQAEVFKITGITSTASTTTLTLNQTLAAPHFANILQLQKSTTGGVEMRAEVSLCQLQCTT